jgi:hypothetical protein
MSTRTLSKAVQTAVNRNAYRLAISRAYQAFRDELQDRAIDLLNRPQATAQSVIDELEHADVDYAPRSHLQDA